VLAEEEDDSRDKSLEGDEEIEALICNVDVDGYELETALVERFSYTLRSVRDVEGPGGGGEEGDQEDGGDDERGGRVGGRGGGAVEIEVAMDEAEDDGED
jgi:hypothetical protein